MVTPSFLKRHGHVMGDAARQLADDDELDFMDIVAPYLSEDGPDEDDDPEEGDGEPSKPPIEFFHITSRCHLSKHLLARDEVKQILVEQCLHYARVCNIALINYCFMDNHFHMDVGVKRDSLPLPKFVGCIKQQFTNRFKAWYNNHYRKEIKYRKPALKNGPLWDGPYHKERIKDDAQLAACTLYIENNRLVVECQDEIGALEEPPRFQEADGEATGPNHLLFLQPCYEDLLARLKGYPFQSARWYLGGCKGHDPGLTDGTDGNWATIDEWDSWREKSVRTYPKGWRRVWFKDRPGILKPTPKGQRRYAKHPFYERLGATPERRAANFGRLLMGSCFRKRAEIATIVIEAQGEDPGVDRINST